MAERRNRDNVGTVVVAALANLVVAAAKAVAGLISSSAALLSESAHSVADTMTELLLLVALRRGARPADPEHPLGHGRESYLWALMAAVLTFVAGGVFSILEGIQGIRERERNQELFIAYVVLIISAVAEGVSLFRATRQLRRRARRWRITPLRVVRRTPNTTVKAVFLEDSAALIGLALAGIGVALSEVTGSPVYDGAASIAIGLLLLVVATVLGYSNLSLLVGRSAGDPAREEICRGLAEHPAIRRVTNLVALQLGPDEILVAAKVDFVDEPGGRDVAQAASDAGRRLAERNPAIRWIFLDPSGGSTEPGEAAGSGRPA
ncbi:cation transporter [Micromonospora sp. NPDC049559]|uniref:cation diffusion facilitator family transporter n=1 Tax=Micromonospora sp. NPDC049559 TaxID=3155923 RepID=UPI003423D90E